MTNGQLAMVVAKAFPKAATTKRRGCCAAKEQFPMVDSGRLAKARTVLAYAPEMVGQVIAGTKSLDAAYHEARNRKNAASPWWYCRSSYTAIRSRRPLIGSLAVTKLTPESALPH